MTEKKPFEIARETLKQITARKLVPTPVNYQTIYNELAGVAVAAIICSWLVSERAQSPPQIVITDVVSMPNLEFPLMTVLRRGEQR